MLFGHNTNLSLGRTVFHIQTEDRGTSHALIDTTVYFHGRVLHRRTNNYFDLLPLDPQREALLRKRIDDQHHAVIEELRTGALQLPLPAVPEQHTPSAPALALELINAKSWLAGRRANLQIAVRQKENGNGAPGASVTVRIDGAAEPAEFSAKCDANGQARLEFEMPKLSGAEPVLVMEATEGNSKGQLRFQLRARPRVPTA